MTTSALEKNILIIDNDEALRDALTRFFESNEFQVQACAMGECIKAMDGYTPDVAIVDIPYKQYAPVLKQVVTNIQQQVPKRIPILITSTDKKVADVAKAVGGTDFLEEPFDTDILLLKVNTLLQ